MMTRERVIGLTNKLGLPLDPAGRITAPVGNGVTQSQTIESYPGRLVRQIEDHLNLHDTSGLLGDRVNRIDQLVNSPFGALKNKKAQVILYAGFYNAALCRLHPELTFVFGDNSIRQGMGGQACIRQQPNTAGVATKRLPGGKDEFFVEGNVSDMGLVCLDLKTIDQLLQKGKRIVLPITPEGRISLGCGLAALPYHAPAIYAFLERWFDLTCRTYSSTKA